MNHILLVEDDRTTRYLLREVLKAAGFSVVMASDGVQALAQLRKKNFDLLLTDIWMPRMNGLELLARLHAGSIRVRVVVMTSDDTPETMLKAVREQAYQYVTKPVAPEKLVEVVRDALAVSPASPPIEVISARSDWVELLVPCEAAAADRIEGFLERLGADLSEDVRLTVGQAFRELLSNAIEWGGKFDPNRKVRIACLRTRRMILYRIADPGPGFRLEDLPHAAVSNPGDPLKHVFVREEKGLRAGGFGIAMTKAMVDELIYNEARNEVVFVKYLD